MRRSALRAVAGTLMLAALGVTAPASAADEKPEKKRPALAVGSIPHDDLGKDTAGNPVAISDHRGKVVIVSFWASWCAPCRKELPVLASLAKKVGSDHLKIIAINYEDAPKPFRQIVEILADFPITILRDAKGRTAKKFEVLGIPRMIVIGRDGKVAADHTGYSEAMIPRLVEELNGLLLAESET